MVRWVLVALLAAWLLSGCHLRTYGYTDAQHQISIVYPGQVTLVSDPAILEQSIVYAEPGGAESSKLSFALQTDSQSILTCAVQSVPGQAQFTPETYFEATTARELSRLGAEIVEPRSEVVLGGQPFAQVGFRLENDGAVMRSRIYEQYDPSSRRVVVLSITCASEQWDEESALLVPIVNSLKLGR
jgi:hypothetical protein